MASCGNKALYEIAMKELDGKKDETLWMMALVATGGDEFEARIEYVKLRVNELGNSGDAAVANKLQAPVIPSNIRFGLLNALGRDVYIRSGPWVLEDSTTHDAIIHKMSIYLASDGLVFSPVGDQGVKSAAMRLATVLGVMGGIATVAVAASVAAGVKLYEVATDSKKEPLADINSTVAYLRKNIEDVIVASPSDSTFLSYVKGDFKFSEMSYGPACLKLEGRVKIFGKDVPDAYLSWSDTQSEREFFGLFGLSGIRKKPY